MKRLVILFSVLFAAPIIAAPVPEDFTFTIDTQRRGAAHGCAVNGYTVTNSHVVETRARFDFKRPSPIGFRYEFSDGTSGSGKSIKMSHWADLALVELDKDPPFGYGVIGQRPNVDDKIYWKEYDFRKRKNVFKARWRDAKVVTVRTGDVLLNKKLTVGASGGCAYNQDGAIIGLMTFSIGTDDEKRATGITGLWGHWWKDIIFEEVQWFWSKR